MFRPYNLKSLAAWTLGSLAGNEAYYRVKGGSRRITLKNSKYALHPNSQRINPKLEAICAEVNSLTDSLRSSPNRSDGKMEIMPLVHLMVYNEWFQKRKENIDAEVNSAENIRSISDHLNYLTTGMLELLNKHLPQNEQQQLSKMIKERMTSCQVSESSYKLADTNSGKFFIQGKIS
jgi:hypothetical protein